MIDTCRGSQLASTADRQALATSVPPNKPGRSRARSTGLAPDHAVREIFSVRSKLLLARVLNFSQRHDQSNRTIVARNDFDVNSATSNLSGLQILRQPLPTKVSRRASVRAHDDGGQTKDRRDQNHRGDRFVISPLAGSSKPDTGE